MDGPTLAYARMSFAQAIYSVNSPNTGLFGIALGTQAAKIIEANTREVALHKIRNMLHSNMSEIAPNIDYDRLAEKAVNYVQSALDECALDS